MVCVRVVTELRLEVVGSLAFSNRTTSRDTRKLDGPFLYWLPLQQRLSTAGWLRKTGRRKRSAPEDQYLLEKIRPMAVEDWLKNLSMAPKSKSHIRGVMHLMFECATRWNSSTNAEILSPWFASKGAASAGSVHLIV